MHYVLCGGDRVGTPVMRSSSGYSRGLIDVNVTVSMEITLLILGPSNVCACVCVCMYIFYQITFVLKMIKGLLWFRFCFF